MASKNKGQDKIVNISEEEEEEEEEEELKDNGG